MYYLLENGKIIDSTISYTVNFPYWEIKDNCLFAKSKNDKLVRPCNENQIKKQSENVFELIDWEKDLVKHKINNFIWHCSVLNQTSDISEHIKNRTILAIYKPDANGNYIKVWEEKENERKTSSKTD